MYFREHIQLRVRSDIQRHTLRTLQPSRLEFSSTIECPTLLAHSPSTCSFSYGTLSELFNHQVLSYPHPYVGALSLGSVVPIAVTHSVVFYGGQKSPTTEKVRKSMRLSGIVLGCYIFRSPYPWNAIST